MIGIVGVKLTPERIRELLTTYLDQYFEAMGKAIDAAGGSLVMDIMGRDSWAPEFPAELRPAWVSELRAAHDGREFYIDMDGPALHDVFVTQAIAVHLHWRDEGDAFEIVDVEIDSLKVRLLEDSSLHLGEARALTAGLITAGKLMVSLLDGQE